MHHPVIYAAVASWCLKGLSGNALSSRPPYTSEELTITPRTWLMRRVQ